MSTNSMLPLGCSTEDLIASTVDGNYTYVRYSNDGDIGTGFSATYNPSTHNYVGIVVSDSEIATPAISDFVGKWVEKQEQYTYYAFATDSSGTGFSTSYTSAESYLAIVNSTTELTPVVGDFAGLWFPIQKTYTYVGYADDDSGTGFTTSFSTSKLYSATLVTSTEETPVVGDFAGLWTERYISEFTSVKFYGAVGDGNTDDSVAIQAAIDANKGGVIVIPEGVYMHSGVELDGATYDDTTILCYGTLKLIADAGASTFSGAWVGLLIKDCDNITIKYRGDGNRSAMTAREQIFNLGIAGASNVNIPEFECMEVRGDAIYVSQSDWTSDTTTPTNINIGTLKVHNSAVDGRNALSIISVNEMVVGSIHSINVGGTIGGTVQPGGVVIEPNFGYQDCANIVIKGGLVISSGTSGVGILGKAVTVDAARDWNCDNISIKMTNIRTGSSGGTIAAAGFTRCKNISFDLRESYDSSGNKGQGRMIDFADYVTGVVRLENVTTGLNCGTLDELTEFDIQVFVNNYTVSGVRTANVTNGRFTGRVYGSGAGTFAIQCHDEARGGITQTGVIYSIDAPYDGTNVRAFRNEPTRTVSYSNTIVSNCSFYGYSSPAVTSDGAVKFVNVEGMTNLSAIPTSGYWGIGTIVYNTAPAENVTDNTIQLGWVRLTTGAGNVAGTDWEYIHTSTVSPAT